MLYQTYAQVHLGNIKKNIEGIRAAVGAHRKILIAVKANAYGHGSLEVSRMAEQAGVDWLGVATVPEGIALREAGLRLPILKLSHAFPEEMEAAVRNSITLAVCDEHNARALESLCAAKGLNARVHIKVDTGMGRIGAAAHEAPELARYIEKNCPFIYLEGIFTHMPVSDSADGAWTQAQAGRFKNTVAAVNEAIGRRIDIAHAANSGAVLGHEEAWFDMVRPGIMIYGYYPDTGTPRSIRLFPGMSMYTKVSFVKKISAGTSVGYGRTWIAPQDANIATIPAGYADGFNRLFSNKGQVLINGSRYPIVGRVCMDQCMVHVGSDEVRVGDEVVIMGTSTQPAFQKAAITCDELAEALGTITYEVTCQINSRVTRYYDSY